MDSTILSLIKNVDEKGSDGVPKYIERSTQVIGDDDFRFTTQAMWIYFYANAIGLGGRNSSNVTTSKSSVIFLKPDGVENIM